MMLYLVEYANWNSQATIGYGCSPRNNKFNMGATDAMTYHTGTSAASRTTYGSVQYPAHRGAVGQRVRLVRRHLLLRGKT